MREFPRLALMAIATLAAALPWRPAMAQSTQATASVSVRKPLLLTRVADMSFGSILLTGSGTFSSSVTINQNGSLNCPATFFSCSGSVSPAIFNASGNKQSVVLISAPATLTLTNSDNAQIVMSVSAPSQLILTNSGFPGTNFSIGGTLPLTNLTADGTYTGAVNVTVQYQ